MSEDRRQITTDDKLRDALAEILLETSKEELVEALGEEEFAAEAQRGRELVVDALRLVGFEPLGKDRVVELHEGLSVMINMLKRREGLSGAELSRRAEIDKEELRKIEFDPNYEPSPRTIYRLEQFFGLPSRSVALLVGAVKVEDDALRQEVVQFAAKSASMGKLSREERRHLNRFVELLGRITERPEDE